MAETLFWAGRLDVNLSFSERLTDIPFGDAVDNLPIEVLADVMLGLSEGSTELFNTWMNTYRHHLISRFRQTTRTMVLEDDGQKNHCSLRYRNRTIKGCAVY